MSRYSVLVNVLDAVRSEAAGTKWKKIYAVDEDNYEKISQARARALIHLYIKVMFGVLDFASREALVTDGSNDAGIDGYYIDNESRIIYLIQSKFRQTEANFEAKRITPEELLSMDIDRVIGGMDVSESGVSYNGKISGLQRAISSISDIPRYKYVVIILANVSGLSASDIKRLTGGYDAEVFDFNRSYADLVFPIVSGNYYKGRDLTINLALDNKTSGGRTSYSVQSDEYDCEITVLFVPLTEVGQTMNKYRNAILQFNPRSYLELEGRKINGEIRESATKINSNEFPILNNGLTILSDETSFSEKVGVKGKAQILLRNPQIINGGQTAYTIGRIWEEGGEGAKNLKGKEALVRVITVTPRAGVDASEEGRASLIEQISSATNRQTAVSGADRASNSVVNKEIQEHLFERFGLFVERKRGEFSDGVRAGYIEEDDIIERNAAIRILYAASGQISKAVVKRVFANHTLDSSVLSDNDVMDRFFALLLLTRRMAPAGSQNPKRYRDILSKAYLATELYGVPTPQTTSSWEQMSILNIDADWLHVSGYAADLHPGRFIRRTKDKLTGVARETFNIDQWVMSPAFRDDVKAFAAQRQAEIITP